MHQSSRAAIIHVLGGAVAVFLLFSSAQASFENRNWGARAAALAGAFTAVADDSSAPFWNPAGTSWVEWLELGMMWERDYPGLIDSNLSSGYFSTVWPTQIGSFAGVFSAEQASGLLQENIFCLNFSRKFANDRIAVGTNLKYLTHDYLVAGDASAAANPVFANGSSQGAFTYDLGLTLLPSRNFTLGFTGRNLTEPDVGLASEDRVPSEFQGGLAWQPSQSLTIEVDALYRNLGASNDARLMLGLEDWMNASRWAMAGGRLGIARSLRASQKEPLSDISAGIGIILGRDGFDLNLDYAYTINLNLLNDAAMSSAATHRIGVSLLFGSFSYRR